MTRPSALEAAPDAAAAPRDAAREVVATPPRDAARDAIFEGLRRFYDGLGGLPPQWSMTLVAGPWRVRERGAAAPLVAAIVSTPARGDGSGVVTWLVAAAPNAPEIPARVREFARGEPQPEVVEVLVRDADRDDGDELLVVMRPSRAPGSPEEPSVHVYAVDTSLSPTWERLSLVEWQIDGSRDAASVDAALASRDRDEAPTEGASPQRFIARLARATPAGFRAVVDARGLRVCEPPPRGSRTRCRTVPAARLDDAQVAALQRRLFALGERTGTDPPGYFFERCRRGPAATTCSAGEYTNNGSLAWTITGAGASMRLAEARYTFFGGQ